MIIAGKYSFNDGEKVVLEKYPDLYKEIESVIQSVNAEVHKRGSTSAAASWGHVNPFYEFSTSYIVLLRRRNRSKQQRRSGNCYFSFVPIANLCGLYQYAFSATVLSEKK